MPSIEEFILAGRAIIEDRGGGPMIATDDSDPIEVVDQASGRVLTAWECELEDDVVVAVGGGERPHVGRVVLALPIPGRGPTGFSPSISVLTIPHPMEEPIARAVSERVCARPGRVTVATAGVHEDGIGRAGIGTFLRLGEKLAEAVVDRLNGAD
jgi:hypothetical protein